MKILKGGLWEIFSDAGYKLATCDREYSRAVVIWILLRSG